jgi:hypothetical protein
LFLLSFCLSFCLSLFLLSLFLSFSLCLILFFSYIIIFDLRYSKSAFQALLHVESSWTYAQKEERVWQTDRQTNRKIIICSSAFFNSNISSSKMEYFWVPKKVRKQMFLLISLGRKTNFKMNCFENT